MPIPPSSYAALAGATVLLNLSASNITIAKADYRRQLVSGQSARCLAAYLYSGAGPWRVDHRPGLGWPRAGRRSRQHPGRVAALPGSCRSSSPPSSTWSASARSACGRTPSGRTSSAKPAPRRRSARSDSAWTRPAPVSCSSRPSVISASRTCPPIRARRDERCAEVFEIQVQGLAKRLQFTGIEKSVIGISGGLDSTQALLVCAQAMDRLGYPRSNILAYTMPGFATSDRTLAQARQLMDALGCTAHELDIRPSCLQMLNDIGHPFADGEPVYDVTFENVQAGERTSHLFRLANLHTGTGRRHRRPERAGAGLVHLRRRRPHVALQRQRQRAEDADPAHHPLGRRDATPGRGRRARRCSTSWTPRSARSWCRRLKASRSSPARRRSVRTSCRTSTCTTRCASATRRREVAFLAYCAWHDCTSAAPGRTSPPRRRHEYDIGEIKRHLGTFLYRFFQLSQFKRSAIPNAPKVGSGGSLSPRGDYRAPSDGEATAWLAQLELIPDAV